MSNDKFLFTSSLKKRFGLLAIGGVVLAIAGVLILALGSHGHGGHEDASAAGHGFHWIHRVWVNLWVNNVYFAGLALVGVLFLAINYAAQAGWSAYIKRIPEAFGGWIPVAGVLMLALFFLTNYTSHFHIFHWLDHSLFEPESPNYDPIIAGKEGYLNLPFFLGRLVVYFVVWSLLFWAIRRQSLAEDTHGGAGYWKKMRTYSTFYIIVFAVTSSMAAWDWVMSIDTHWYSTMFGWYNFASWFVAGLAAITLVVITLREMGYLLELNSSHLHDLGKFVFAFSIFWTYIWFSQFMLIYYANIPEETVYFMERLHSDQYGWMFFTNLILNFVFPFLLLMTRDSKRHSIFLKIVCYTLIVGHWFDFYLMIAPGSIQENGGFGLLEVGLALIFASAFFYVIFATLAKAPLVARNHPMLGESLHHHI
jgi:hypothetical protein